MNSELKTDMDATDSKATLDRAITTAMEGDIGAAAQLIQDSLGQTHQEPTALQSALMTALECTRRILGGHYFEELPKVLPVLDELERSDYADKIDWLYTAIGFALGNLGDPERGLEWTARALAMTESMPASTGLRKALNTQGALLAMLDQHEASMQALGRALQIATDQGVVRSQATCLGNLAYACLDQAWKLDIEVPTDALLTLAHQALDYATRAQAITQANDFSRLHGFATTNRGFALLLLGEVVQAREAFIDASALTKAHDDMHVEVLRGLAIADRKTRDFSNGRTHLAAAEALARREHFEAKLGRVLEEGVQLELAASNTAAALEWSQRHVGFLKQHYPNRLKMLAHSAEMFANAERIRREAVTLRAQSQVWKDAAQRDALTGVFNRRGLSLRAADLFEQGRPLALAAFDADHFKLVNDRYGHATGDAVLVALTQVIAQHTRDGDVLARVGGEEFVLLLQSPPYAALATCERIRVAIQDNNWQTLQHGLQVTSSVGLAARRPGENLESLVGRADAVLYTAKQGGRNRTCVAD